MSNEEHPFALSAERMTPPVVLNWLSIGGSLL